MKYCKTIWSFNIEPVSFGPRVDYSSAHLHYGHYPLLEADESVASNTAGDGLVEPVSLAKALYAVSSDRWFSRRRRHRT